jgi:hypothetical protein
VVFVTEQYIAKVGGTGRHGSSDNCKAEFEYAYRKKTASGMVLAVLDKGARDQQKWTGPVGLRLGGKLYTDMVDEGSGDANDKLARAIRKRAPQRDSPPLGSAIVVGSEGARAVVV